MISLEAVPTNRTDQPKIVSHAKGKAEETTTTMGTPSQVTKIIMTSRTISTTAKLAMSLPSTLEDHHWVDTRTRIRTIRTRMISTTMGTNNTPEEPISAAATTTTIVITSYTSSDQMADSQRTIALVSMILACPEKTREIRAVARITSTQAVAITYLNLVSNSSCRPSICSISVTRSKISAPLTSKFKMPQLRTWICTSD